MKLHYQKSLLSFEEFDESITSFDGRTIPTALQSRDYEHVHAAIGEVTIQKLREGGANFYQSTMEKDIITVAAGLPGFNQIGAMGHTLNQNTMAIARSGEEAYSKCDGDGQYLLLTVSSDKFSDLVEGFDPSQHKRLLSGSHRLEVFESNWCGLTSITNRTLRLLSTRNQMNDSHWASLERDLLDELVSSISSSPIEESYPGRPRISRSRLHFLVRQFLQEVNPDSWSLSHLARHVGVHERSLRNIFLELYGVSPKRFLTNLRLMKVREALGNVDNYENISQIASNMGFWQWGHMSGEYKKLFGETPNETRNRLRKRLH